MKSWIEKMGKNNELWPGQNVANLRSRLLGSPDGADGPRTFSGRDQKTVKGLEAKHQIAQEGKPSVNDRLKWGKENIQEHVGEILVDDLINPDLGNRYISRIMAFDREMGLMPEKPRSQVRKVADAIVQEFDLKSNNPNEAAANRAIAVRPEVLLTNATKDVLKSFSLESLALTPLILALMVVRKMPDGVKSVVKSAYDKLPIGIRMAFLLLLSATVLAACNVAAGTPTKEVDPGGGNNPNTGEITGLPSETEESSGSGSGTAEAPTLSPEEQRSQDISLKTQSDVDESIDANPLLRQINIDGNLPEEIRSLCVAFATKLDAGRPGQGSYIDVFSETNIFRVGFVDSKAYCYVTTADGTVIVDAENNAGFLYLTPAIASQALGVEVARVSADGRNGSIGDAYDAEGRRVGGVSRFTMQWEKVNADGVLPSEADPSSVPPTPINPEQSNIHQVNYAPAIDAEAQAQAMTNLAISYENGDVADEEIDKMSFEKRKEFSIALNEYRNKLDGEHSVTYTDESGKILYLGPDGKFHSEPQTIETRIPSVFDDEGFLHVFYKGEWIKIEGSNNIQFDNDIKNGNFKWPSGDKVDPQWVSEQHKDLLDLTVPEYLYNTYGEDAVMVPIFFLEKTLGEINIPGRGSIGSIMGLIINEKDPYSAITAIVSGGAFHLYKDNTRATSIPEITERSDLFKALETKTLYYLMLRSDQKAAFDETYPRSEGIEVTTNYSGLASSDLTNEIITGELESTQLIWINGILLVEASNNP